MVNYYTDENTSEWIYIIYIACLQQISWQICDEFIAVHTNKRGTANSRFPVVARLESSLLKYH